MPTTYSRPSQPEDNRVPFEVLLGSMEKDTGHVRTRMVEVIFFPDTETING
jgi:hypothetical protein